MKLGDKIKRLRIERGMTQDELAAAIGATNASISNYERNLRKPQNAILYSIASALGVSLSELVEHTVEETNSTQNADNSENADTEIELNAINTERIRRLLAAFNILSDEAQKKIIERTEELTEIPRYRRSILQLLPVYLYINYKLYFSLFTIIEDKMEMEKYNNDFIALKHIILGGDSEQDKDEWHFKYYQFDETTSEQLIESIFNNNLYCDWTNSRLSLIVDKKYIYSRFCDLYHDYLRKHDALTNTNDLTIPRISFILVDKYAVRIEDTCSELG